MKIVITGASGTVGRLLVPLFGERGVDLLLLGRDRKRLQDLFPNVPVCDYDGAAQAMQGFDTLLHLAVLNNDTEKSLAEFQAVNVDFSVKIAQKALDAQISHIIDVSSLHALDPQNDTGYAVSKRDATQALQAICGDKLTTVFLAYVYGDVWSGRLAVLNRLPKFLSRPLFKGLAALKPTIYSRTLAQKILDISTPGGRHIITDGQAQNWVFRGIKRFIDLAFCAVIFVCLWWVLILIWAAIRLDSPGPGIFAQQRVGKNGQVFWCYKFRTMKQGTRQAGTHEVSDMSVTRIGGFLRATKIDELPQIWNLLVNDMSLIGPRPGLPQQEALFKARDAKGVYQAKPGISGLAQIAGVDMSHPERLADIDSEYLARQSLLLDISIILATVRGKGQGDKTSTTKPDAP